MTDPGFLGVGVALLTVFADDGSVDVEATARHAARLTDLGVRAVIVAGTTGEAETLEDAEREELIAGVRDRVPRDIPVIAGASAAWPRATARRAVAARKAGADGVLVLPPRGGRDLVGFYSAVTEAVASALSAPSALSALPAVSAPSAAPCPCSDDAPIVRIGAGVSAS